MTDQRQVQLDAEQRAALLTYDISHLDPQVQAALRVALTEIKQFEEQRARDLARLGQRDGAIVRIKMVAPTTNGVRAGLTQIMERLDAGLHAGTGTISGTPTGSHYQFQVNGTLENDGPDAITHMALVCTDGQIDAMPASSADHALHILQKRAEAWEFDSMEAVDLSTCTIEALSGFHAEGGDPETNWVAIAEIWTSWPVGSNVAEERVAQTSEAMSTQAPIRLTIEANSMEEFFDFLTYTKQRSLAGDRQLRENDGLGNRIDFARNDQP